MKKTLTANISGTVFHMEEDAYRPAEFYLDRIRGQFAGTAGRDEIMADIEARIAELLQERLDGRRDVVTIDDVEHVMTVMGQPEDFADGAEETDGHVPPGATGARGQRRLYRDPDDKWVGGVLGGIAAYFGIDPLVLRLIYLVLLFVGVGWLIYLVLWVVVPRATTAGEKLEMRGEPVTVDNIKRVFEEGAERVKEGARTVAGEAEELGRRWNGPRTRSVAHDLAGFIGEGVRFIILGLGKLLGFLLLVFGAALGAVLMAVFIGKYEFLFGNWSITGDVSLHDLTGLFFDGVRQANTLWIAALLFLVVPVVGLLLGGMNLLFGVRSPRWIGWALGPAWIGAIVLLTVVGLQMGRSFRLQEEHVAELPLEWPTVQVLTVAATAGTEGRRYRDGDGLRLDADSAHLRDCDLDIERSPDGHFHLYSEREARGRSSTEAARRARGIRVPHALEDSTLRLSAEFTFARADKWRVQKARWVLQMPVGASVYLDRSVVHMLYDVDNTSDTWDRDMVGRTWTMTRSGLSEDPLLKGTPAEAPPVPAPKVIAAIPFRGLPKHRATAETDPDEFRPALSDMLGLLSAVVRR